MSDLTLRSLIPRTIPDRDRLQRRLHELEGFETDALRTYWTVNRQGPATTVEGTTRPRLAFSVEGSKLKLFITARGSDLANMTFELASELTKLCHIKVSEHGILLMLALTEKEEKSIENAFQCRGLSFDVAIASGAISKDDSPDPPSGTEREPLGHTLDNTHKESRPSSARDQPQDDGTKEKPNVDAKPPGNKSVTRGGMSNLSSTGQHDISHPTASVISKRQETPQISGRGSQPGRPIEFVNVRSGVIKVAKPRTLFFGDRRSDEVAFYGELYVCDTTQLSHRFHTYSSGFTQI